MPESLLGKLTRAECLFLNRRRKGMNQQAAADIFGVTVEVYCAWEKGQSGAVKTPPVGDITPIEQCIIARRRAGKKQQEIADESGMTRWQINQIEAGKIAFTPLWDYWASKV